MERERNDFDINFDPITDSLRIVDKPKKVQTVVTAEVILEKLLGIKVKEIEYEE